MLSGAWRLARPFQVRFCRGTPHNILRAGSTPPPSRRTRLPRFCWSDQKIPFFRPGVATRRGLFASWGLANGEIAMKIKASGRLALIITAGFWMCFAGPMHATESDARASDSTAKTESAAEAPTSPNKPAKHASKKHTSERSGKSSEVASKPSNSKKADDAEISQDNAAPSNIPPSVANPNARVQPAHTPPPTAVTPLSAQPENVLTTPPHADPPNP